MVVIPAHHHLDIEKLQDTLSLSRLELVPESMFPRHFIDCELGALPPFGSQYGMPVYLCGDFDDEEELAFCAGRHTELVKMTLAEYKRLEKPVIIDNIANPPGVTPPKMSVRRGRSRL